MESRSTLVSLLVVSGLLASGCVSIGPDFETPASEVSASGINYQTLKAQAVLKRLQQIEGFAPPRN